VPLLIYFFPRRALAGVLVLAIVAAPILRAMSPGFHAFVNTPWRSDSLLSGALLAVLVRWHPFVSIVRQHQRWLWVLFVPLLLGAVVLTLYPAAFGVLNHSFLAALYSTFILMAFIGNDPFLDPILGSSVLVWLGRISYGIYMFHEAVSGLLHGWLRHGAPQIQSLSDMGITLVALCTTLALALLSYRFFESPFLRMGHRFQYLPKHRRNSPWQAALSDV
jgi:peptidoglycan/LPS O-acetylase OafA/YrhL